MVASAFAANVPRESAYENPQVGLQLRRTTAQGAADENRVRKGISTLFMVHEA